MTERQFYTLADSDVAMPYIKCLGRTWRVEDFLGQVLPQDVGKRVYRIKGILQVENNEQRDQRMGRLT